jgi:hypothetical protein
VVVVVAAGSCTAGAVGSVSTTVAGSTATAAVVSFSTSAVGSFSAGALATAYSGCVGFSTGAGSSSAFFLCSLPSYPSADSLVSSSSTLGLYFAKTFLSSPLVIADSFRLPFFVFFFFPFDTVSARESTYGFS